jgi:broad specificity phosphatase PhoE
MTRLLLVRHARPAAGFDAARDPGLDAVGREQAQGLVARVGSERLCLLTSPLRRARETAAPLARHWQCPVAVATAFGEIPTPDGSPAHRAAWLRGLLDRRWPEVDPHRSAPLLAWRSVLLEALAAIPTDSVVVSHFVAINTVVGCATGDDRLVSCSPGHASVTEVEVSADRVTLRSGPSA